MVSKSYKTIVAFKLSIFSLVLVSLLQCDNSNDDWECTQALVDKRTISTLNDLQSYVLDPPKLIYNVGGPSNICPSKSIKIVAGLLCKKNPPISINAICYTGKDQFYTNRIVLSNYDSLSHKYTSNIANTNCSYYTISCKFEISWTPLNPYENEQELNAFVNKYFDEIQVQYNYFEYKP